MVDVSLTIFTPEESLVRHKEVDGSDSSVARKVVSVPSVPGVGTKLDLYRVLPVLVNQAEDFLVVAVSMDVVPTDGEAESPSVTVYAKGILTFDYSGKITQDNQIKVRHALLGDGWMVGTAYGEAFDWDGDLSRLRAAGWTGEKEHRLDPCEYVQWVRPTEWAAAENEESSEK